MDWTRQYFDEVYLKYFLEKQSEELTEKQVDFIVRFFANKSSLLDAGCGIGRHSVKLGERGFGVLGIDSSPLYIEIARKKIRERNLNSVKCEVLDLRELNFKNAFDGIISMWSSFGYFDDKTNEKILYSFYTALARNGKLIIDIENRDYILKYFIRETFREKDGVFIMERRRFHPLTSVITTHRYIVGKDIRKDYIRHIRVYSATEMINLFKYAGFTNVRVFGDYDFSKFSEHSKRIIIVGEK